MNRHASPGAQQQIRARRAWGQSIRSATCATGIVFAGVAFAFAFASVGVFVVFGSSVFFANLHNPGVLFASVYDPSVHADDFSRRGRLFAAVAALDDGLANDHLKARVRANARLAACGEANVPKLEGELESADTVRRRLHDDLTADDLDALVLLVSRGAKTNERVGLEVHLHATGEIQRCGRFRPGSEPVSQTKLVGEHGGLPTAQGPSLVSFDASVVRAHRRQDRIPAIARSKGQNGAQKQAGERGLRSARFGSARFRKTEHAFSW